MPVGIYLDADSCGRRLVAALQRQGFDVLLGTREVPDGASDVVQFNRAIESECVMVTGNLVDFARLQKTLAADGRQHFGLVTWAQVPRRSEEAVAAAIAAALLGRSPTELRNSTHYV